MVNSDLLSRTSLLKMGVTLFFSIEASVLCSQATRKALLGLIVKTGWHHTGSDLEGRPTNNATPSISIIPNINSEAL